jgi:hypothetical protein
MAFSTTRSSAWAPVCAPRASARLRSSRRCGQLTTRAARSRGQERTLKSLRRRSARSTRPANWSADGRRQPMKISRPSSVPGRATPTAIARRPSRHRPTEKDRRSVRSIVGSGALVTAFSLVIRSPTTSANRCGSSRVRSAGTARAACSRCSTGPGTIAVTPAASAAGRSSSRAWKAGRATAGRRSHRDRPTAKRRWNRSCGTLQFRSVIAACPHPRRPVSWRAGQNGTCCGQGH